MASPFIAGQPANAADIIALLPAGVILPWAGISLPSTDLGWTFLLCDGTAVSRSTYASLFAILNPSLGTATMTIASPTVVSLTAHGLVAGDPIYFTTTGALPTGVSANTRYYVITAGLTANAFQFSATLGGAAINATGSQSGTHTLRRTPYGLGDGSTTFNLPDLRANTMAGMKAADANFANLGAVAGAATHTISISELPAHTHTSTGAPSDSGGGSNIQVGSGSSGSAVTGSAGSGTAMSIVQATLTINYIIKT